ncbi:MAG: bifunctional glutamate N-acetyltransferase/amino-acid acetyltransferase ArgJ [Desulfobacterales bacterium]|nr:bifunctional glutamate N-acetyltransferase/amino-acid acetyltransferase ArgJ [Desulfobacterales bacterium]MBF0397195.1 bifunctional glutamate N-acetyltransferase/amino-acid acetyltransferase ArgJ [Desulfobacterales bacterium]
MEYKLPKGFKMAGVSAGIKKHVGKDLGLIYSEVCANAAGVFTKNIVQAAPVKISKERIKSGKCQAIIVNSGNANCCTGEEGLKDAASMTSFAASELNIPENLVVVGSTGVIGEKLPIQKVLSAVPNLVASLSNSGVLDFTHAIMTTDKFHKIAITEGEFTVTGIAKGAGMIRPDMATMLCFVCTDADIEPTLLDGMLHIATDRSFNRISVDGDTSTNDTIIVMANGLSGVKILNDNKEVFQKSLDYVLLNLAKLVVKDGEGATKLVEIIVKGAKTKKDARIVADTIAHSSLVKTALFGQDANWGRILAAVGRSGIPINPDVVHVFFDDIMMVKNSMACKDAESKVNEVLKKSEFTITIDLNMGIEFDSVITCDLTLEYVRINADYRS